MDKRHSLGGGAGAVEEPKGNRASHLGPHLPRAVEGLDPIEETLQVLRLGLVPCVRESSPDRELRTQGWWEVLVTR